MPTLKSQMKLLAYRVAFSTGILDRMVMSSARRRTSFAGLVINYHSFVHSMDGLIETESCVVHRMENFKSEIRWLRRHFDLVNYDEFVSVLREGKGFPRPSLAITVDDGFADNYEILFPWIEREKIPVIVFLTAGLIGTRNRIWVDELAQRVRHTPLSHLDTHRWGGDFLCDFTNLESRRRSYVQLSRWLKDLPIKQRREILQDLFSCLGPLPETERPAMLSWDQVREMSRRGVLFGAHTCTHPILSRMPLEEAVREIRDSKDLIENAIQKPVRHFAYPNGRAEDFSSDLRDICLNELKFESISSCAFGANIRADDVGGIKRIGAELPLWHGAGHVVRALRSPATEVSVRYPAHAVQRKKTGLGAKP